MAHEELEKLPEEFIFETKIKQVGMLHDSLLELDPKLAREEYLKTKKQIIAVADSYKAAIEGAKLKRKESGKYY